MTFAAVFAIAVGILMMGQWVFLFSRRQIPELETEPYRISFHIAGEMLTAIALIVSGYGLLMGGAWSEWLILLALGMLLYTAIVSPGYFAQKGQWTLVGAFALLLILALMSLGFLLCR